MVLNGLLELAQLSVGDTPIGVGLSKIGVQPDSLAEVIDRPLILAQV